MSTITHEAFLKLSAELMGKYRETWEYKPPGTEKWISSRFAPPEGGSFELYAEIAMNVDGTETRRMYTYQPQPGDLARCERFEGLNLQDGERLRYNSHEMDKYIGSVQNVSEVINGEACTMKNGYTWPISALTPVEKEVSDPTFEYTEHQREIIEQLQFENERLRADKWINVKDGLPDTDIKWHESEVLQVHDDMGTQTTAFYNSESKNWIVAHHRASNSPINVTHWQPLPEPPKTESK